MVWAGSSRRSRLPHDWSRIRPAVLERDPFCTCTGCAKCRGPVGCGRPSTDVDHLVAGDDHQLHNLRGLCWLCHRTKSSREGAAAAAAKRGRQRREPEAHPGLRNTAVVTTTAHPHQAPSSPDSHR